MHAPADSPDTPADPAPSQTRSRSFGHEVRQLLRLGGPIALVQLGMTSMNFVDVAMLGHHDAAAMPAMALGATLANAPLFFCMGVGTAIDPLLAQAIGARDHAAVPRALGRGLLLALLLSLPCALLLLPATAWLTLCGQPAELVPEAAAYARWQAAGVFPFLAYGVLRALLQAHGRVMPQIATIVAGNLLNALFDWLLIFGKCGFPALGASGAAIATVANRWLMLIGLVWFGRAHLAPALRSLRDPVVRAAAVAKAPLVRIVRLGLPIGCQFLLEIGAFAATALLIGWFDAAAGQGDGARLGGHQIALQLASLSFMVPLGLGIAASVRVGWAVGRGDAEALRRSVAAALATAALVMSAFMLLFLLLPGILARAMSGHEAVVQVAIALIPIAGAFQIGDGLQVVAIGCLRGLGDTRSPLLANVCGFWLIGLPLGCWLAFGNGAGPAGLWWGLVAGLFLVAAALILVLRLRLGERRDRIAVD